MGAKTEANAKVAKDSDEKRPAFRCDVCERNFLTITAIKSHMMSKHPEKCKKTLTSETETKDEKKTAFVPPTSRASKRLQQKKSNDKESVTKSRKTVFECPKCLKEFGVFFPAMKHIQNRHCEDKDGNPVSSDSPDLIKPIRKEICTACDKPHLDDHVCGDASKEPDNSYCCLACQQVFNSVASFDEHVEGNHDDSIGVVILEDMNEFLEWKSNIEAKQRVKYLTLSDTTQKQYYQCNYVSPQNSALVTHLCPSVMIVREFSKGLHVRYHKDHFGHTCENLKPDDNTAKSEKSDNEEFKDVAKNGDDFYTKLKDLMSSIAQRASTLDRAELKPLYQSALKMQAYLDDVTTEIDTPLLKRLDIKKSVDNKSDNEHELENTEVKVKKVMTDDQIVKALEGTRPSRASNRLKRKSVSESVSPTAEAKKKPKKEKGLKESNSQIDLACTEQFESPKPKVLSPMSQSSSFNDSYKQFIDSTSPMIEKPRKVKKEVVKTKIGHFTPSPKRTPVKESENVGSRKKRRPTKSIPIKDLKLEDLEYEVIEQENDCNILILKI